MKEITYWMQWLLATNTYLVCCDRRKIPILIPLHATPIPIAQQGKVVTRRDGVSIAANHLLDFEVLLSFNCFMQWRHAYICISTDRGMHIAYHIHIYVSISYTHTCLHRILENWSMHTSFEAFVIQ